MFPFSKPVNPVLGSHLDSQFAFFNDFSRSLSGSFQSLCEANLKLSQTMFEETMRAGQRVLTTGNANDMLGAVASGAQPTADTLRAYQQHISRLTADAQVELARVTQQHGEQTSRTAHALADEVTRVAVEANERSANQNEETLKNFRDQVQHMSARGNGSAQAAASAHDAASAGMKAEDKPENTALHADMQAQAAKSAQQSGDKHARKPA